MRRTFSIVRFAFIALLVGMAIFSATGAVIVQAPQAGISTPFHNGGDSFFENFGVNFGFNIPAPGGGPNAVVGLTPAGAISPNGINLQQGGAAAAVPPFGGFVPGTGATTGFRVLSPLGNASFGFNASQGNTRSMTSQSPSVTVQNGFPGFFSDTSQRPFVTSIVPVVGGFAGGAQPLYTMPAAPSAVDSFGTSALAERLSRWKEKTGPRVAPVDGVGPAHAGAIANGPDPFAAVLGQSAHASGHASTREASDPFSHALAAARQSSAGQPAAGVKQIVAEQAAEDHAMETELREILGRAEEAVAMGKPNVARIYYQQLARRATGDLKRQALDALERLKANSPAAK